MKVPMFEAYIRYAEGSLGIPPHAPRGGTNFISAQSLSEAIEGALANGSAVNGKAILVGDENLTFAAYLTMFFRAVGSSAELQASDEDHPLMPRSSLYTGSRTISYEPDADDLEKLGNYRRQDIENAVTNIVAQHYDRS
jgi:dihydroflavonol-4-reductase